MNAKATQIWFLIWVGISLVYGIFLVLYLQDSGKYAVQMSQRDQNFRKIAVVVTWIEIVLSGLIGLGVLIDLLSGSTSAYSPVAAPMGWI